MYILFKQYFCVYPELLGWLSITMVSGSCIRGLDMKEGFLSQQSSFS